MYKKDTNGILKHWDFLILDLICLQIAFCASYILSGIGSNPYQQIIYRNAAIFLMLADFVILYLFNTLKNVLKRGYYKEFAMTVKHGIVLSLVTVSYLFVIHQGEAYSRLAMGLMAVIYVVLTYTARLVLKYYIKFVKKDAHKRSLLVVTQSDMAEEVIQHVNRLDYAGYVISGIAFTDIGAMTCSSDIEGSSTSSDAETDTDTLNAYGSNQETNMHAVHSDSATESDTAGKGTDSSTASESYIDGIRIVAATESIAEYVRREWVDEVLIVLSEESAYPDKLVDALESTGVVVHVSLKHLENMTGKKQFVEKMGDFTVMTTSINYMTPVQILEKRIYDIIGGIFGMLIAIIVGLIYMPILMKESPGPLLFKQERVGRNGRKFTIYKFRTMVLDAEERKKELMKYNKLDDDKMFKLDFDPRVVGNRILADGTQVTGFAQWMRAHSVDEFPQFFNVIKGEMSIVGTRPPIPSETESYELHHKARLAIKPGVTGLWQISGRSDITDFEEVLRLDKEYISSWSMGQDIRITLKTIKVVIGKNGAA